MRRGGILITCLLLLAGAYGILAEGGAYIRQEQMETALGKILSRELSGIVIVEEISREPEAKSEEASPAETLSSEEIQAPVPVRNVQEAWDEAARETEPEPVMPEPLETPMDVSLELRNQSGYAVEFSSLPELPQGMTLKGEEPVILIMHTHGSEAYAECASNGYRSQDPDLSVIRVGEVLGETLENRGYHVIHDTTLCDYPEYTGAYNRSREVIQKNLEAHPSLALVLDVHRDAVAATDGSQVRMACTTEEGELAQLMLVVGTDAGGLLHPDWRENLSLGVLLQGRLQREYPGLMRPLNLREERFNQDLGTLSLLCEFGTSGNTLEEAVKTAAAFGTQLAQLLDAYCSESS